MFIGGSHKETEENLYASFGAIPLGCWLEKLLMQL